MVCNGCERTTEEQASDNFRAEFEWLELFRAEDQVSLGCKTCKEHSEAKTGFAGGKYEVGNPSRVTAELRDLDILKAFKCIPHRA